MKINSSRSQKELKAEIARLRQELDALKKSRAAGLAAVIHDSADGILVIDQGGSVCLSNPEAERILRRRGDDLVGSPLGIPAYGGERTEVDILTPDGDRVPVELWTRDTIWAGEPAIRVSLRDLTVQRKAESALRESEARYRILAESTLDCIWIMAPDLTITYVNPAVQRLFGYTPEEYTGTALARHCDPAQLARIQEIVETELAKPTGSDGVTLETVLKHRDGHSVPVEITATIIYDDTGGLLHFQGVTRDITERKKAFEREQRLAAIVRSSKDAIVSKTVDGIITSWNAGAEAMYGYTAAEAVGKHIDMLVPPDMMAELDDIFKQIAAGRSAGALETVRLTKGGKRLPVWLTVSPIHDEDGRVIGASSVARDISDLKETLDALHRSEALLNETGDMARVGGWEIDLRTETVYWTQTIRRIHEVPEDYVPDLEAAIRFFAPEARSELTEAVRRAREEGIPYDLELPFVTAKGRRLWTRCLGQAEFQNGRCVRLHGTFQDITELKRADAERRKAEEQLQQAQKLESIGRLAGGVAHDFNNMLSVIIGYGETLLDGLRPNDPLREDAKEIVAAGNRSAALTRQLLAFSRRQTLQPEVMDLNDLLTNLENLLQRLIGEDVDLSLHLRPDLLHVKADPGQIEQVIMNLAVNARDAMPEGGKLTVETDNAVLDQRYADAHLGVVPGQYVMVSVSDTGCGMDPETRERIFEPFFTSKEKGKGTGLGLATVYGIVKQSGGNIWVYSEPNQGTTFKIYLPQTADEQIRKKAPLADTVEGRGEAVLVVEDEPSLGRLCQAILGALHYTVHLAANGGDALLQVEEKGLRPDLLVTDVVMPGMSGKVVAERLKKRLPDLKVLYMSGYTDNAIVHHGVLDADTPFIQKPVTKAALGKAVRQVLDAD